MELLLAEPIKDCLPIADYALHVEWPGLLRTFCGSIPQPSLLVNQ